MTKALMVGWAHTQFGKSATPDLEGLIAEVGSEALRHAGLTAADVDFATLGVYNNGFAEQRFEAGLLGVAIPGLETVPAVHLENACATGSAALYAAMDYIESGRGRVALVVGAEKMTGIRGSEVGRVLQRGAYLREEGEIEGGFAGIFGVITQSYFDKYGNHSEDLARIAAKNHKNGLENPYAHMRKGLSFDFCNTVSEQNPRVAGPLRRTDCSLVSDGAAAIVLVSEDMRADLPRGIAFRARCQSSDIFPLSRRDMTAFAGARRAWEAAKSTARISLGDLDFVETHDCFTTAEMIEYEAMGLTEPGEGWKAIREGWTQKDGRLPVNPSGGLKAKGHPLGATGVSQHVMAAMQLMGEAEGMQIPGAKLGAVFNMGGAAVANYVSVLERRV